jgi:predicted GH43/DUF377 family glycosyl hydrolase
VVLSLRAVGEGHISSLTFRSGIIDAEGRITMKSPSGFACPARQKGEALYDKVCFEGKLLEMGLANDTSRAVMSGLEATFTFPQLEEAIRDFFKRQDMKSETDRLVFDKMLWLARCNYELGFDPRAALSERIIFPVSPSEQNGIEDARFVRFTEEDGKRVYYATYTAYDGKTILPQLLETEDFLNFKMITLNGPAVENKGMALFPRKIRGSYAMISRQDNENLFIMYSDNLHFWHDKSLLLRPSYPWEFVQTGNCGSPIETGEGWLVLTHGVGPVRKYCIGAVLLDLEEPGRVIGRLKAPLIIPGEDERSGYVPNVVYTCGAIVHNGHCLIPYAISDRATTFARVEVEELLSRLKG